MRASNLRIGIVHIWTYAMETFAIVQYQNILLQQCSFMLFCVLTIVACIVGSYCKRWQLHERHTFSHPRQSQNIQPSQLRTLVMSVNNFLMFYKILSCLDRCFHFQTIYATFHMITVTPRSRCFSASVSGIRITSKSTIKYIVQYF